LLLVLVAAAVIVRALASREATVHITVLDVRESLAPIAADTVGGFNAVFAVFRVNARLVVAVEPDVLAPVTVGLLTARYPNSGAIGLGGDAMDRDTHKHVSLVGIAAPWVITGDTPVAGQTETHAAFVLVACDGARRSSIW